MINTDVRNMPGFRAQDFLPSDVGSVYTFSKNVTEIVQLQRVRYEGKQSGP